MLAYPIAEAETLLEGKLSGAQQTLENCEEDLDFLREQITVRALIDSAEGPSSFMDTDIGGCHGESVQLGCHNEEEREGGVRAGRRWERESHAKWIADRLTRMGNRVGYQARSGAPTCQGITANLSLQGSSSVLPIAC